MKTRKISGGLAISSLLILLLGGCSTLPENDGRISSKAYIDSENTFLGSASHKVLRDREGESGFFLLSQGLDAFVARGLLANRAERSIDAQYYLLHKDLTGRLFIHALVKAANRGVRVRLLVDDMDLAGKDVGAAVLDSHPNVEVRLFNPFSRKSLRATQLVTRFGSVTRRMHNKSFTVDNQATILGGRNIGDEYFGADSEVGFKDLDVLVFGPAVEEVSASFDAFWNSELAYPASTLLEREPTEDERMAGFAALNEFVESQMESPYVTALRNSDLVERLRTGSLDVDFGVAHTVSDSPEKILVDRDQTRYQLAPQIQPYFQGVEQELLIFSPYFVPGKSGTAFLGDLSRSGVRVRVLTNSLASTDVPIVHSGYAKYRRKLLRAGVELYEMKPESDVDAKRKENGGFTGSSKASLHTKSFLFDREHVFIGSLNLYPRSVKENTEIGVVLESPELGERIASTVIEMMDKVAYQLELSNDGAGNESIVWHELTADERKTYGVDPGTTFWQRAGIGLMALLPVESQL